MEPLSIQDGRDPDFELDVEIRVLPEVLRAFLVDLHRYVPLHPFIESIQDMPADERIPSARRYRVVCHEPASPPNQEFTRFQATLEPR